MVFGIKRNESKTSNGCHTNGDEHHVSLQQVVKTYESTAGTFTALRGIDLRIKPGEFVSIIGKSGSGKSTLINMITGIDRPTAGQVFVGETAVHTLSEEQIAVWRGLTIGIVFQFFQLLPTLTAIENVMLPMDYGGCLPPAERPERAMHLLGRMGMADYAHKLPSALSGGQQQSIAIARAMANDPPILAADEPTGNLDSKTAESVFRLFEDLAHRGKTVLMVTHDDELARRAQRTVVIADGEIVDERANQGLSRGLSW
jgi:putative ABC transport system ATP-binding protein